jgi:hypothetical protein
MRLERKINQENGLKRTAVRRCMCFVCAMDPADVLQILPTLTVTVR